MIVKRGNVIKHTGVDAWGSGKVVEVSAFNATIQFSDGVTRKIASSHFNILEPGDPATLILPEPVSKPAARASSPRAKKVKLIVPAVEIC